MKKKLIVKEDWCKKCGICIEFCPKKVLSLGENSVYVNNDSECVLCGLCELRCPDYAIYLEENK